jgi:hypothetical protein
MDRRTSRLIALAGLIVIVATVLIVVVLRQAG